MSRFFTSGGQSIGVSASASVLLVNIQDWFPLGFDLLSVQEILKSLLQRQSSKASIFWCSAFFIGQFSHPYMMTGKTIALTRWTFSHIGSDLSVCEAVPQSSPQTSAASVSAGELFQHRQLDATPHSVCSSGLLPENLHFWVLLMQLALGINSKDHYCSRSLAFNAFFFF